MSDAHESMGQLPAGSMVLSDHCDIRGSGRSFAAQIPSVLQEAVSCVMFPLSTVLTVL